METQTVEAFRRLEEQYFGANKDESAELERLPGLLDGVRCFADIGASLGQYSYFAAKATTGVTFYCVEADPYKAQRLRARTGQWAEETGNEFQIIEKAASDKLERLTFFIPKSHMSSGALIPLSETADGWEKVEVEADTIDAIFDGVDVDFMKLDIEGAEYRALVGAEGLLRRCNLRLLLEIAPWGDKEKLHRPSDVLHLLAGYGYDFTIYENHYLFAKTGNSVGRWMKSRMLGFILDRPGLKRWMKSLFNRFRGR